MIVLDTMEDDSASLLPDLTPLLDVMFIVLVFLLLNMQALPKAVVVDLPQDTQKVAQELGQHSVVTLGIDTKTQHWLLDDRTYASFAQFQAAALRVFSQYPNKSLVIAADKQVPLQDFMRLITWLQAEHKTHYSVLMEDA